MKSDPWIRGWRGGIKRHWFRRCCGQRMWKRWIFNDRGKVWGKEAVCRICGDTFCTGTPYG